MDSLDKEPSLMDATDQGISDSVRRLSLICFSLFQEALSDRKSSVMSSEELVESNSSPIYRASKLNMRLNPGVR